MNSKIAGNPTVANVFRITNFLSGKLRKSGKILWLKRHSAINDEVTVFDINSKFQSKYNIEKYFNEAKGHKKEEVSAYLRYWHLGSNSRLFLDKFFLG